MPKLKVPVVVVHFFLLEVIAAGWCFGFLSAHDPYQAVSADDSLPVVQDQLVLDTGSDDAPTALRETAFEVDQGVPPVRVDVPSFFVAPHALAGSLFRLDLMTLFPSHGPPVPSSLHARQGA